MTSLPLIGRYKSTKSIKGVNRKWRMEHEGERARLLKAQADMSELKVRQRQGELLTKESVTKATFANARRARDQIQNLPARYSGLFAAEHDQAKIFIMLTKAIHEILTELSNAQSQ